MNEEKQTKAAVREAPRKSTKKQEILVYTGPTIPGVVATCTTYNNGLPQELQELKREFPAIGLLIVPAEKLAATRAAIAKKNTAESACYTKVMQYIEEKEK